MKKPLTRVFIDARQERTFSSSLKRGEYRISGLETDEVRRKIYEAIGKYVHELALAQDTGDKLIVSYNPSLITLTYIDYLFNSKGIEFKRDGAEVNEGAL